MLMHAVGADPPTVLFPALPQGKSCQSAVVPISGRGESVLVTVVMPGANPAAPALRDGDRQVTARAIGHDPTSRLGFLRVGQNAGLAPVEWLADSSNLVGASLRATVDGKAVQCEVKGWVKKVGGKVLPLALLQVNFEGPVPPPGTPLMDSRNRVAALFFQGSGGNGSGYAIPVEAVHRIRRDIMQGGEPVRGWLGLTLSSESQTARVVRVLTDSPAALAGVMPGDILLAVGSRPVADYADVANAFFYLSPGEPTRLRLKRGTQTVDLAVTPTRPQRE
ncbi:MAG: S1C family serine protease [Akkermansiaceae bacterium]|nr:S1C family serine protease [Akkermansiaceae bacterium]